jgi:catechol 2,3-dioxygenase-like lactoylglutathione lyase family enzyme
VVTSEPLTLHHLAVQTRNLDNCVAWYRAFFDCQVNWELDTFSELTLRRLPGIGRLVELSTGDLRFHVFNRAGLDTNPPHDSPQFQHACVLVGSAAALRERRERWYELSRSGRYTFDHPEPATDIVVDADGVASFYALDVNGLEFEFTYIPGRA